MKKTIMIAAVLVLAAASHAQRPATESERTRLDEHRRRVKELQEQRKLGIVPEQPPSNAPEVDLSSLPEEERKVHLELLLRARLQQLLPFDGGIADSFITKSLSQIPFADIKAGETVTITHEDGSRFHLVAEEVDEGAARLAIGDVVYTITPEGVTAPGEEELRRVYTEMIGGYNPAGPLLEIRMQYAGHTKMVPMIGSMIPGGLSTKGFIPDRLTGLSGKFPSEFILSLLCVSYGPLNGKALMWEKAPGYAIRTFPQYDNAFETISGPRRAADFSDAGATVTIGGESVSVEEGATLPFAFKRGSADVFVLKVVPQWEEVILASGGRRLALTSIPADLADADQVSIPGGSIASKDLFARIEGHLQFTLEVHEKSATSLAVPNRPLPVSEFIEETARMNGLMLRWRTPLVLVLGPVEDLMSPAFEEEREKGFW